MFCNVAEQLGGGGSDPKTDPAYISEALTAAGISATINGEGDSVWIHSSATFKWDMVYDIDREGVTSSTDDLNGITNTDWMLKETNLGTTDGTIWKFCQDVRNATEDGKWYVPSIKELQNRRTEDGSFRPRKVWSSTENTSNPEYPGYFAYMMFSQPLDIRPQGKASSSYEVVLFHAP